MRRDEQERGRLGLNVIIILLKILIATQLRKLYRTPELRVAHGHFR